MRWRTAQKKHRRKFGKHFFERVMPQRLGFRKYSSGWDFIGYASERQYNGQAPSFVKPYIANPTGGATHPAWPIYSKYR